MSHWEAAEKSERERAANQEQFRDESGSRTIQITVNHRRVRVYVLWNILFRDRK